MSRTSATALGVACALAVALAATGAANVPAAAAPRAAAPAEGARRPSTTADLDGDGRADLVTSSISRRRTGIVVVDYSRPGLADAVLTAADLVPTSVLYPEIGLSLAIGDFNADGYADLVVGTSPGQVTVIPGSATGLQLGRRQVFGAGTPSYVAVAVGQCAGDSNAGPCALAVADTDGDGYDDLLVGGSGVEVLFGSSTGLTTTGEVAFTAHTRGIPGTGNTGEFTDGFGDQLAAGDLDGDGYADLVLTDPGATCLGDGLLVVPGSATGPDLHAVRVIGAQAFRGRGYVSVAVADFDADGFADVAAGTSDTGGGEPVEAGAVAVFRGRTTGPHSAPDQTWTQDTTGVPSAAEARDHFGQTLAAGDVDADGHDDLAVGVPDEGLGRHPGAGAVELLRGGSAGLTATGAQLVTQDTAGVPGAAENYDQFGSGGLRLLRLSGRYADLVAAATNETVGTVPGAGSVTIVRGSTKGLIGAGATAYTTSSFGAGAPTAYDRFGEAVGGR